MKNHINFFTLFLLMLLTSCGNSTSSIEENAHTIAQDTTTTIATTKAWGRGDVSSFWQYFIKNVEDKSFLKKHTYFPYGDGYIGAITEIDFDKEDFNHFPNFFNETQTVTIKELGAEDYLNYQIEELFLEEFGSKADIFAVKKDADPMGYYAYFKYMDNQFWFIGYEELQDASH